MLAVLVSTKRWFVSHEQAAFFIKVIFGSLMIALFAQISVPMYPVPITGQTLAVTVVGLALGKKAGLSAVMLYLCQGAVGLPVFAGAAAGLTTLLGPTGGYLYGFIAAVAVLGYFSDKGILKSYVMSTAVALFATVMVFIFGLVHLSFFVPKENLLQLGFYPFIIGGIIKAVLAAALVVPTHQFFSKL